jgi:hypothetical protein
MSEKIAVRKARRRTIFSGWAENYPRHNQDSILLNTAAMRKTVCEQRFYYV